MDGDIAPLSEMVALAERYTPEPIVDEAHATGCFGATGGGLVCAFGLRSRVLATVHTGGKALGVPGAYIAGSRLLKDYLINRCRHFMYTTASPPQVAAWWLEALLRVRGDESAREALYKNTQRFRRALEECGVNAGGTQYIVPVPIGVDDRAVAAAEWIGAAGYDIRAIRPPTVGSACLRVSIHADHTTDEIEGAAAAVAAAL